MSSAETCVVILTTVGEEAAGEAIARALVDERLAACVNLLPAMASFYRWDGQMTRDVEHQLVIKTTRGRVAEVEARVSALHPYDLPEFLVLAVEAGNEGYCAWICAETARTSDG
jgi:periplasmic divalent cation tolerance protein